MVRRDTPWGTGVIPLVAPAVPAHSDEQARLPSSRHDYGSEARKWSDCFQKKYSTYFLLGASFLIFSGKRFSSITTKRPQTGHSTP